MSIDLNTFERNVTVLTASELARVYPSMTGLMLWITSFNRCRTSFLSLVLNAFLKVRAVYFYFFFLWGFFFHKHSQITGLPGKGEGISLILHYHFHRLRRHLDISRAITAESSPLHIASARLEPGTFGFRAQVANH